MKKFLIFGIFASLLNAQANAVRAEGAVNYLKCKSKIVYHEWNYINSSHSEVKKEEISYYKFDENNIFILTSADNYAVWGKVCAKYIQEGNKQCKIDDEYLYYSYWEDYQNNNSVTIFRKTGKIVAHGSSIFRFEERNSLLNSDGDGVCEKIENPAQNKF